MKLILICCLGLQLAVVCALAAAATQIKRSELVSGFDQLNLYLKKRVASPDDLLENLKAARELVSIEQKRISGFSLWPRAKRGKQHAAELFVTLLEVAGVDQSNSLGNTTTKCDQRTAIYLDQLNIVHANQLLSMGGDYYFRAPDEPGARYHLVGFGNVDKLLDTQLVRIIANCESQFVEPTFERLSSQLDPQVDEKLNRQVLPESTVDQLDDMKHDHRVLLASVAHRNDMDRHKAALESRDLAAFTEYYRNLYRTYLSEPCKVFFEHFVPLLDPMAQIDAFRKRYMIPVERSRTLQLAQARQLECYMVNELAGDQVVGKQALDVLEDYLGDLNWNNLKWKGEGRRLY